MVPLVGSESHQVLNSNAEKSVTDKSSSLNKTKNIDAIIHAVLNGSPNEVHCLLKHDKGLIRSRFTLIPNDRLRQFYNATLLHLVCFRKLEENEKIGRLLIASAKEVNFDIVNELASEWGVSRVIKRTPFAICQYLINKITFE